MDFSEVIGQEAVKERLIQMVKEERLNAEAKAERKESKILKLTEFVTVSELAPPLLLLPFLPFWFCC